VTTSLPLRDVDEALAITGGSLAVADAMLRELLDDLPGELAAAGAALDAGDWEDLRAVVHRMKGGSAMCAVPALHTAICGLQGAAQAGDRALAAGWMGRIALEQAALADLVRDGAVPVP
jgi:HPt (histidine-containing phosphotransfer) domain-containing protein